MTTDIPSRALMSVGDVIDDRYKIERLLGEGSFGHVYKVNEGENNWALKMLRLWDVPSDIRKPLIERFDMEFKTGQIESDYLVHSVAYGIFKGNPYIVMEYCPGGDLNSIMNNKDANMFKVASDVLHGLFALHSNGKVHRDLKPENVLFKSNGIAALTDFGISGDGNKRMTERNIFGRPCQIFGTYAYMPPEQVSRTRGVATVLPTTDIFSFGVMMYQLITGSLPFGPLETQNDLVLYQKRGKTGDWNREQLRKVHDGEKWERIISGCLCPDLKDRFQNVKEVIKLFPDQYTEISEQVPVSSNIASRATSPDNPQEHVLRVMHGSNYGMEFFLPVISGRVNKRIIKLGRDSVNDFVINSAYASRLHCTLEADVEAGLWRIRDGQWNNQDYAWNKSSNGTFVNSREVSDSGFWLESGDIITIGDDTLRFE